MRAQRATSKLQRIVAAARADDGMALATVMAVSAILFILATALLMIATQQAVSAGSQVQRNKALASADTAVNEVLYRVKSGSYVGDTTVTVSGGTSEASWTAVYRRPGGVGPVLVTATGTTPNRGNLPSTKRVVKAQVQQPTFADYMFMLNTGCTFGAGALVKGNVRSNGNIQNNGTITGSAYAAGTYSGSGTCQGSVYQHYATLSFASVDYGLLKSIATTDGTNFESLPEWEPVGYGAYRRYWGYNVEFTGAGGTITPIRAVNPLTGVLTENSTATVAFTIPANGVLYFDYPIWVSGTYSSKVTVATFSSVSAGNNSSIGSSGYNTTSTATASLTNKANSAMYLWNHLVPQDPQSDQVCGVVSRGDISVPSSYATMPSTVNVTCALLSTAGSVHADIQTGYSKTKFHFEGAFASYLDGGFVNGSSGFLARDYWYDARLNATPPPNYPPLGEGQVKVQSWVEQ